VEKLGAAGIWKIKGCEALLSSKV
jgi:hypothetical protein